MFTIRAEVRVNDDAGAPRLNAEQVYSAMVRRARASSTKDPELVPPGHRFEILEDHGDWLTRHVTRDDGQESTAKVTFHGPYLVVVHFIDGWQRGLMSQMLTVAEDGELLLNFTALSEVPGMAHNSPEEQAIAQARRKVMGTAPAQLLTYARQLAAATTA
ncbi:AtaL-like protein [Streptomyces sioyaensis]|uniref:AtaL-like protein n=1 Tax=Streptomyces sioyaensis TaxID=67364 RepID=UPI0037A97200